MLRTHTCGELNEKNLGQEVRLSGWVHSRRDHGNIVFIDLRDKHGLTQLVFWGKELIQQITQLRSEYVIGVQGKVNRRPKGTENPKLPTGLIEIGVSECKILNPAQTPPFEIAQDIDNAEDLRFTYRYLDLRRPGMANKLVFRHRVIKAMRDFLDTQEFLEVETPLLTKSTPEGARDFLVASRLNPGKFYALPQSPQLFKQILMVAGLEKYFQVVKCLRDEDLRADRQPEFTQLDIELSFVEEEDIFSLTEALLQYVFKQVLNIAMEIPFPRLSYQQARESYQSDKPDLRSKEEKEKFKFLWINEFPLFKYNPEEKRWDSEHHPFTAPLDQELDQDLGKISARAYDLVLNGVEIASGSIRIHQRAVQEKIFSILKISKKEAQARFGFLLQALDYGAPPHGGIALGLDRFLALLSGDASIREVIAFPKTQKGICPLTGAPAAVSKQQLQELGINLAKTKRRR
ncbi:MAG: aspartate--tRNA ligase [Candidatus Omnitrophica bacterium]|nr:aspartate--tRNA ligase [Candidatus Omnitrophota bacterium]